MNGEYKTSITTKSQRREFVLDFIRQKDLIRSEDILILSEKVFVINAVLNWCYDEAQHKKLKPSMWEKYKRMIAQYVAGVVDIKWTKNRFEVTEVIHDNQPRRTKR